MIRWCFIILFLSVSVAEQTVGSLGFMNISPSANSRSLGNTYGSEISNPSSLLMSPANIWQYSNAKFSVSNQTITMLDDVKYYNFFVGKKISKNLSIAAGGVYYAVENIEEYNDFAQFLGYFDSNSGAFLFGISNKVSNFSMGIGLSMINENLTKMQQYDNISNSHVGVDIGLSILDWNPGGNIYLSFGGASKSIVAGIDRVNSAYSTTTGFLKISRTNDPLLINAFLDFQTQPYIKRYLFNAGVQVGVKVRDFRLLFNIGMSSIPIGTEGDSWSLYFENNKKISCGFNLELPWFGRRISIIEDEQGKEQEKTRMGLSEKWKVNIAGSYVVFDAYYGGWYGTISFTHKK